jgi:hypothetical protein
MEKVLPVVRWDLCEENRAIVDGVEYVIYTDEVGIWAIEATKWDAPTARTDYSDWCSSSEGYGIGERDLCARIAAKAGLKGIYACGVACWIYAADEDSDEPLTCEGCGTEEGYDHRAGCQG